MVDGLSEALKHFGAEVVRPLGGRLNLHWLVRCGREERVLRKWDRSEEVEFERSLRSGLHELGWPVPVDVSEVWVAAGHSWSLMTFLPGEPAADRDTPAEQRRRGRLLAEFHLSTERLGAPLRPNWRPGWQTLQDPQVEKAFAEWPDGDLSRLLLWHWHLARELLSGTEADALPTQLIHGDFTPWNLLFQKGRLSGVLDWEMARPDWRVADFALAWRGRHDEVVKGYREVSPLSEVELQLLTPSWWALLLEGAYRNVKAGTRDDWTPRMLLRRSPLMPVAAYPL